MTVLSTTAREQDALVLAVDHFGKDVSTGTRNSSVKEAHVDAVLALLGERHLAGKVSNPRMAIRKLRGGPTGAEIKFSTRKVAFQFGEELQTSLVVDWNAAQDHQEEVKSKSGGWPKSLMIFKRALDVTLTDRGKKIKPHFDGPELLAATREAVRDEFYKSYMADNVDTKRQTFNRCEKEALIRGIMGGREHENQQLVWSIYPKEGER